MILQVGGSFLIIDINVTHKRSCGAGTHLFVWHIGSVICRKTKKVPPLRIELSRSWDLDEWQSKFTTSCVLLGGGFKYVLFSPVFGEDFQFDSYFSDGLKPPTRLSCNLRTSNLPNRSVSVLKKKHIETQKLLVPGYP